MEQLWWKYIYDLFPANRSTPTRETLNARVCRECGHSECWRMSELAEDSSDPHSWYLDGDTWRCRTCIATIVGGRKPCD